MGFEPGDRVIVDGDEIAVVLPRHRAPCPTGPEWAVVAYECASLRPMAIHVSRLRLAHQPDDIESRLAPQPNEKFL